MSLAPQIGYKLNLVGVICFWDFHQQAFVLLTFGFENLACPARFERATYALEGRCSIQLSYGQNMLGLYVEQ